MKYDPLGTFHIEKDVPGLRRHANANVVRRDRKARLPEARRCSCDGAEIHGYVRSAERIADDCAENVIGGFCSS